MPIKELINFIVDNLKFKPRKKEPRLNPPEIREINTDGRVFCKDCKFLKRTNGSTGEIKEGVYHIWDTSYYVCNNPEY